MAKRFTATEIWDEDWFLEMPIEYKLFWYYMLSNCDFAGLFKVNLRSFCGLNEVKLSSKEALKHFNNGKERIRVINEFLWLIEDFFVYQYGTTFNPNNRVHLSIQKSYNKHNISMTSIRGLIDLKDGVKDKAKDKDIKVESSIKLESIGEQKNDSLIYDIELYLKSHEKDFQVVCMNANKPANEVWDILHKYHLWNQEKENYPKKPLALISGLQRWILNEKSFTNGKSVNGSGTKHGGASKLRASIEQDLAAAGKADINP